MTTFYSQQGGDLSDLSFESPPIDFEQFTGPAQFDSIHPPLAIGIATISGGQLLNAATFLPVDQSVVYGTAYFCSGCLPSITIDFSQKVANFSVFVVNGQTFTVSYTVEDDLGDVQNASLPANFLSGAGTIMLPSSGITQVRITSNAIAWDFFIDNVRFAPLGQTVASSK